MRLLVIACSALLVLGAGFLIGSSEHQAAAVVDRILSQPLPQKLAWVVILVAGLALISAALWLTQKVVEERKSNAALEARFRGVRDGINNLEGSQRDAESAADYLARTDPDHAIKSLQQRLERTEQTALLQQSRNEAADLSTRVEDLRDRQKAFREILAGVIGKRRSIEQLLAELQRSQDDIDGMLAGIEGDGSNLQDQLAKLTQSLSGTNPRFDEIERSMEALVQLKRGFGVLQARLLPLEQNEHGGINNLIKAVHDIRDQLVTRLDFLDREGGITLVDRVAKLAEIREELDARISGLLDQLSKLEVIHKDMAGLFAKLSKEINANV
jgi:chromosome segregation ATPase